MVAVRLQKLDLQVVQRVDIWEAVADRASEQRVLGEEPVRADDITAHVVAPERYALSAKTADAINRAREARRRIIAVGTTRSPRVTKKWTVRMVSDLTSLVCVRFRLQRNF